MTKEYNFDGLVGPTHNYSGLSLGNIASTTHRLQISNPKKAALQGLEKMWFLAELGVPQAVLPPHERPHIPTFRELGFIGADKEILSEVYHQDPQLLLLCSSSANMWTANAATFTPSIDSVNEKAQFTPANLITMFHRSIEPATTRAILQSIFFDHIFFDVHPALPPHLRFADEGAANHTRFCRSHDHPGIHLFVYGSCDLDETLPSQFPARQTLEASAAIGRSHRLYPQHLIYTQQNPKAIDLGVFHNDVIAVGNENLFFFHEEAFLETEETIAHLRKKVESVCGCELHCLPVSSKDLSIEEAVKTYLFNSQILTLPNGLMTLIAPKECSQNPRVHALIEEILCQKNHPLSSVHFLDLHQSMKNGGGPACLRLRVVLEEHERKAIKARVFLNWELYLELQHWIEKHYRDRLAPDELADPHLLEENHQALDELTKILNLGSIYSFQKE